MIYVQIYTSYFANLKNLPQNVVPISIALKTPAWFSGARYGPLAPTGEIFSAWKIHKNNDLYVEQYTRDVLSNLKISDVHEDLNRLSGGKDVVLLCYEKPGDFCHRHPAAKWFSANGIPVREWGENSKRDEWVQQALF